MAKSLITKHEFNGRNTPTPEEEFYDFGGPTDFTLDKSRGIQPGVGNKSILSASPSGITTSRYIPSDLGDELNGINSDRDLPKDFSDYGGPRGLATTGGNTPLATIDNTGSESLTSASDPLIASEEDRWGPLNKAADPREVISNVIGYLHENGLSDIGHAVFNIALPRLAPIAAALKPTALASDDTLENRPDLEYGGLRDETQKAFSPNTPVDTSDADSIANAAISSLEAPTVNVGGKGTTSGSKNTPSSVAPLKTASSNISDSSPMSDEEIHQWNLQHNPNYDPRLFDIASGSFNYNKGNDNG